MQISKERLDELTKDFKTPEEMESLYSQRVGWAVKPNIKPRIIEKIVGLRRLSPTYSQITQLVTRSQNPHPALSRNRERG